MVLMTLHALRTERGLSPKEVAAVLGVTIKTYIKYENDSSSMTIEQAKKIANYYVIQYDEIFFGNSSTLSGKEVTLLNNHSINH